MPGFTGIKLRSTTARGYDAAHRRERTRLKPIVDAGNAYCRQPVCVMTTRWIAPGSRWALGHNDARTAWIGPVHERCNQRDGASKGGKVVAARRHGRRHPRAVAGQRDASRSW